MNASHIRYVVVTNSNVLCLLHFPLALFSMDCCCDLPVCLLHMHRCLLPKLVFFCLRTHLWIVNPTIGVACYVCVLSTYRKLNWLRSDTYGTLLMQTWKRVRGLCFCLVNKAAMVICHLILKSRLKGVTLDIPIKVASYESSVL